VDPRRSVTMIVTVGAEDGVMEWAPVLAPQGLVGHVQRVDRTTSVVLAWTHPDFRASALALDSVSGIVAPRIGDGATTMLEMREVASQAEIPPGTLVVTSGLGGIYPRGIPIGRIRALVDEREGWSKTYLVEPAVQPAAISHVLVLLPDTTDVSDAFVVSGQ
jgi:rod shape-determining protein MreC